MSTPFATTNSTKALHPDVVGLAPTDVIPEALVIATSTKAGAVEGDEPAVRVPFVEIAEGDVGFVPEGADIDEAEPDSSEVVIHTGKVAVLTKISREQWVTGSASSMLSDAVRRALILKANAAYLSQTLPTAPATTPPPGLLSQPVTNGGTITDNLDALVDAIATIEDASGTATHILASPTGWAELSKFKTADDSNVSLVGAGTTAATRTLLSVPVLVSSSVPDATLLVLDKASVLSVYGQVLLATSTDYYFGSDNVALRATFRFGAKIADTARVVKLTIAGAGS